MNDDIKLLKVLHGYAQRRMVAVLGQVDSHFGDDAPRAAASVARLERQGLLYVQGAQVRLTLPGFAVAATAAANKASVHRLGQRTWRRSRAA